MEAGSSRGGDERDACSCDVPSREPFRAWLRGSLIQERDPKTASIGPVSERHLEALEEMRRELLKHGYSRRQLSNGNLIEAAIDLFYAHTFDGRRVR